LRVLALVLVLGSSEALAAEPPEQAASSQFALGVELASQGDYDGALRAFTEAHAASPNFAVLYNIGQTQVALGRPLEATATLSRYLREGRDAISPERRKQVEDQMRLLESFLIDLEVTATPGASIAVDGREVGRAPLAEPVRLTAGAHKMTAHFDVEPVPAAPKPADTPLACPSLNAQTDHDTAKASGKTDLRRALPYALAGAGVALGASALGVYLWKRGDYEQWQEGDSRLRTETPGTPAYQSRAAENQRLAGQLSTANDTMVGLSVAGGALLLAGAAFFFLDNASAGTAAGPTVAWGPGSSVVTGWGGTW
jgi:tetratricopeptide (TPR) repeat protein